MSATNIKDEEVKREIMEELQAFGLTLEDLETAEGEEEPKWLQNWKAGKRLNTFERSMQQQALEKIQKDKESEKERTSSIANDSDSLNASFTDNEDENKSGSRNENNHENKSDSPTPTKDNGSNNDSSSIIVDNKSVDTEDSAEPELDPLDELFEENPRKDDTHIYKGFYLEKTIAKTIDKKAKKGGKGMKSKIVNEALKIVFKEKGWIH